MTLRIENLTYRYHKSKNPRSNLLVTDLRGCALPAQFTAQSSLSSKKDLSHSYIERTTSLSTIFLTSILRILNISFSPPLPETTDLGSDNDTRILQQVQRFIKGLQKGFAADIMHTKSTDKYSSTHGAVKILLSSCQNDWRICVY